MKRNLFLFMVTLLTMNLNAQLLFNNKNVIILNDLNKDQLDLSMLRARTTIYIGGGMILVGMITAIAGNSIYKNSEPKENSKKVGENIIYGGSIITGLGIPVLIDDIRRKRDIELLLMKFEASSAMINGIGLKIRF